MLVGSESSFTSCSAIRIAAAISELEAPFWIMFLIVSALEFALEPFDFLDVEERLLDV